MKNKYSKDPLQIIDRLLIKYGTKAAVGRAYGVCRSTATPWFMKGRIPQEHWEKTTQFLPGVTLEECYHEFGKDHQRKSKNKSAKRRQKRK